MARGFLSGALWGGVVCGLGLAGASVITGPVMAPQPVAEIVEPAAVKPPAPVADVLPRATPEPPSRPGSQGALGSQGEAASPGLPDEPAVALRPGLETAPPPVPDAGDVAAPPGVPEPRADNAAMPQAEVPVLPNPQAVQPVAPPPEDLSIATNPAQPAAPQAAPEGLDVPRPGAALAPEPDAETRLEMGAEVGAESGNAPPVDMDGAEAAPEALQTAPQLGAPAAATSLEGSVVMEGAGAEEAGDQPPILETQHPLDAFAVPPATVPDKPLMSIVLIDDGSQPLGLAALESFPYPLTFAIDPAWDGAGAAMARYRAAGFEVMALAGLPQTAGPGDVAPAMERALEAVPEAVAVLEGSGAGLQASREIADAAARHLAGTGHGLVLYPQGLNTAVTLAKRAGVPSEALFRDFDAQDQSATVIRRFLDQAAFKAGQEGAVIMLGRLRAETISALLLWGLQDRADRVSLVPVSSILTRDAVR